MEKSEIKGISPMSGPIGPHPSIATMNAIRKISIEPSFKFKPALLGTASILGMKRGALNIFSSGTRKG